MNLPSPSRSVIVALALSAAALGASTRAGAQVAPRARPVEVLPSLRGVLGLGVGVGVAPGEDVALVGGTTAGVKLMFPVGATRHFVLHPDLGFSSTQGYGRVDQTLWTVGLSPGFLWDSAGVAWAPRVLLGTRDDRPVWGVRNGLRLYLLASFIDVEVAHQLTVDDQGSRHELVVSTSLDVGLLAGVLYSLATHHPRPRPAPPPRPADAEIAR